MVYCIVPYCTVSYFTFLLCILYSTVLTFTVVYLTLYSCTIVYRTILYCTLLVCTECPNKHVHSVTNLISSLLRISIVIPDFKSHNLIMSARVYFMKTVNGCNNVTVISLQDEQCRRICLLCL